MIQNIRINVEHEKRIVRQMMTLIEQAETKTGKEQEYLMKNIDSLKNQLKLLNESIPELIKGIGENKKLISDAYRPEPEIAEVRVAGKTLFVTKQNRASFIKELNLSSEILKKINRVKTEELLSSK